MTLDSITTMIALASTLALSILVPLFTQIANNTHQRKLQREKLFIEEKQRKRDTYTYFLAKVGSVLADRKGNNVSEAASAIYQIYAYAPQVWWEDLDNLCHQILAYNWDSAADTMFALTKKISTELNKLNSTSKK